MPPPKTRLNSRVDRFPWLDYGPAREKLVVKNRCLAGKTLEGAMLSTSDTRLRDAFRTQHSPRVNRRLIKGVASSAFDLYGVVFIDPVEHRDISAERAVEPLEPSDALDRHLAAAAHSGIGWARAIIGPDVQERMRAPGNLE